MEELFSELENRYTGFQLQVELLLQQLLVRLVRNYEEKKETGRASGFFAAADKTSVIIEDYFLYEYQSLSLEAVSYTHLGTSHLYPSKGSRTFNPIYPGISW